MRSIYSLMSLSISSLVYTLWGRTQIKFFPIGPVSKLFLCVKKAVKSFFVLNLSKKMKKKLIWLVRSKAVFKEKGVMISYDPDHLSLYGTS